MPCTGAVAVDRARRTRRRSPDARGTRRAPGVASGSDPSSVGEAAGVLGAPGARGQDDGVGVRGDERLGRLRVALHDLGGVAEALDQLDEVVGERVVVIDDEDHRGSSQRSARRAYRRRRRDRRQQRRRPSPSSRRARSAGRSRRRRPRPSARAPCPSFTTAVRIVMQKSRSPSNVQVADRPAVRAPRASGSCSAISSIARRFGAPRQRAGRERHGERVERVQVLAEVALHRRDDVHHLREPLDLHQLGRARRCPATHTRPRSLRARSTSIACSAAPSGRRAARARAAGRGPRSRPRGRVPAIGRVETRRALHAHERLGRGAGELHARASARRTCTARGSSRAGAGRSGSRRRARGRSPGATARPGRCRRPGCAP